MFIKNKNQQQGYVLELCLCGRCLSDFLSIGEYKIMRLNSRQERKDVCTICNIRNGFDYKVERYKKKNRTFEERYEDE